MKIKKGLELVSRPHFPQNFMIKKLSCNVIQTGQIFLPGCICFPSYSVKCISCFMLRHLMTSWDLNIWTFKIWLSLERKKLSKWNKEHFFLVSQVLSLRYTKQTSKNVADKTFKVQNMIYWTYYIDNLNVIKKSNRKSWQGDEACPVIPNYRIYANEG